ncbi:hypothetical protein QA641_20805 [Bradyrhizobium sp. CB1650]|uniref:hypothetical protein n=1 Tax=Bradyrhizobium sp. CB1650 TaxID=3039153 RepID=UPI002435ADF2|nr:hypothetical protein [Bradyrhizobium sp. CB1650]WGD56115.1 hypothetical protein QA641_20805 [Bradyrhizobium sp. CB1650]
MKTDSTISGSEMLLTVIAIRLAVLVLAGWSLALLPRQTRDGEVACVSSTATRIEAQSSPTAGSVHVSDSALDDMLLHD